MNHDDDLHAFAVRLLMKEKGRKKKEEETSSHQERQLIMFRLCKSLRVHI